MIDWARDNLLPFLNTLDRIGFDVGQRRVSLYNALVTIIVLVVVILLARLDHDIVKHPAWILHAIDGVGLEACRLDGIHLPHFPAGQFARNRAHARTDDRCLESPSRRRRDRLPRCNRLPGNAIQFPFTLLDHHQNCV